MKLGHVHIKVSSVDRAVRFYTELLGLEVVERVGQQFSFLSFGKAHHDLALQSAGAAAQLPPPGTVGLYHTAFEVEDERALYEALLRLEKLGSEVSLVDHRISWAIYTADPDGNGVEIYLDRRTANLGKREWQGDSRRLTREEIRMAAESRL